MAATLDRRATGVKRERLPGPVGFIGAGKVGTALAALLNARGVDVVAVSGRNLRDGRKMALAAKLDRGVARERSDTLALADIVFLTVPDDSIEPLCREIAAEGGWRAGQGVVHCSGALPADVLRSAREMGALIASFHPLQTFASLDAALSHMPGSTFALEGDGPLVEQLDRLVELLDGTSLHLRAEEKTIYHAAAAIASNYTVTLAALAADLLVREGIAPDANTALRYLMPLLRGTVDNLEMLGVPDALTGPLVRGDVGTVRRHIEALQACEPQLAHLYQHLAQITLPLAEKKGTADLTDLEALNRLLDAPRSGD